MRDDYYRLTQSRYKDVPSVVTQLDDAYDEYFVVREKIEAPLRDDDRFHRVVDGDRIDLLAYKYLGDARHWWVICDYNDINFPLILETGTMLRIPSIEYFLMDIVG